MSDPVNTAATRQAIAKALATLATRDCPPGLEALAEAVRADAWVDIAEAARQHLKSPNQEDLAGLHAVWWIGNNPTAFGLEVISKSQVIELLAVVDPALSSWSLPNPRRMWKDLGLDHLPQGRGRGISQAKLERAKAQWMAERHAKIAEIRSIS